jgi:hypothetical protein
MINVYSPAAPPDRKKTPARMLLSTTEPLALNTSTGLPMFLMVENCAGISCDFLPIARPVLSRGRWEALNVLYKISQRFSNQVYFSDKIEFYDYQYGG